MRNVRPREVAKAKPPGFLQSRTATPSGRLATSTQSPPALIPNLPIKMIISPVITRKQPVRPPVSVRYPYFQGDRQQEIYCANTSARTSIADSSCVSDKYGAGPKRKYSPRLSVSTPRSASTFCRFCACEDRSARKPPNPSRGEPIPGDDLVRRTDRRQSTPSRPIWCQETSRRNAGVRPCSAKKSSTARPVVARRVVGGAGEPSPPDA